MPSWAIRRAWSGVLIAALTIALELSVASQTHAQSVTCVDTLDYRKVIAESTNLPNTANACIVGSIRSQLKKFQESGAKSKTCFTNDDIAYCSQSMAALANSAQFTAPFEALAKELSQKTGKDIKPTGIMTAIVRNFDTFDQGKSELVVNLDGYNVTFSARDVLYAHLAHSLRTKNVSMADQPIPREAKDCFEAPAGATARACRDLGKIIAGRAFKGLETTIDNLAK